MRRSVVVIGAGIAGLSAAAALADRFERVIVLDRDQLPDAGVPRRGAPQGHHPHTLLVAGQRALEALFPGLRAELLRAGALAFDSGQDLIMYRYGTVWPRVPMDLELINLSRPLLELTIRQRVTAMGNVTVRDATAVSGLTGSDGRVTGVVIDDGEHLPADLVVDCSGRGSRSDRWLAALGFSAPQVAEVKIGVGYVSRFVRRSPGDLAEGSAVLVLPTPPHQRRVGVLLPVEGDRWLVGVGGWHGDYPRLGEQAFRDHARSLPYQAIAHLLDGAEPMSEVATHHFPSSRRRLFERLRQLPGGFVTAGDAMCSFNPVYGQGMTCAALEAQALARAVDAHPVGSTALVRAFYRAAARVVATPWRFAVGADFTFPDTAGPKPPGIDLLNGYSTRLQHAALTSVEVRRAFSAVQHLVTAPAALFAPGIVARVLLETRRGLGVPA